MNTLIQGKFPNLAVNMGWRAFEYSVNCGLVLNPHYLFMIWDMNINQKSSTLPFIANYFMERMTVDRKLLLERLAMTIDIVTNSIKPEVVCILVPSLLTLDFSIDLK